MKRNNTKTLMVFTILFASAISMPMVVSAQENANEDSFRANRVGVGLLQGFQGGFGALFGQNMGYGGKILESIFNLLFLQDWNLTAHEMLGNVFVLSVNRSVRITGETYNFADENDQREIYFAPHEYNDLIAPLTNNTLGNFGHAYCIVEKEGEFTYELEIGVAITLVIWDNDRSFITAVNKLLNFFKKILVQTQILGREISRELITEGVSLLTWFLIHLNDIFTGDELFVLNPITWQKLDIIPGAGFNITKTWYLTGDDMMINFAGVDQKIDNLVLTNWTIIAQKRKDNYMQWLLTPTLGKIEETVWTQFSFDLIQLWIKNFEIHIDIGQILNAATGGGGATAKMAFINAFNGANVEFYLFTHHLAGAYLYNDTDKNGVISANYSPINIDGASVEVPQRTELTHRLILGTVGKFEFKRPTINPSNKSISWGLNILDADLTAVPLGVDLHSYIDAPVENLDYIYFGFTFETRIDKELGAAHGIVKLDQFFAPWNDAEAPYANGEITNLDLAIIYVSTVLHFQLDIATQGQTPTQPTGILQEEHYNNTEHKLKIGNYLSASAQGELEFVDIAGPDYEYGNESSRLTAPASTSIINPIVWTLEHERHDTYAVAEVNEVKTYSSEISVQAEFNVLVYAVSYPQFEGGTGIWHDPSFSVYMVFSSTEFWALIVLVAGIALVGIATILIKRRKDSRF
ncbi:MAG: hypothetical protein Lokiarch_47890 [Candidatus Lokiarchaeum sp. GC14_75]|nr:MAG: hypothetical protein Lokiarch_47890 [Candidatus Lokiarchaeum sp. GC14_75]